MQAPRLLSMDYFSTNTRILYWIQIVFEMSAEIFWDYICSQTFLYLLLWEMITNFKLPIMSWKIHRQIIQEIFGIKFQILPETILEV